ncbi:Mediator of RNA polymerase II transcription subunit 12-like protein [Hypsibius exemplaris]|uniref:Mediator of RNA polymerase II transcription subunit 12-like protein n=1 Tax=Hypsibius exemplaris TaxID=2072580 RepID=A0A1W0WBU0_HYPEX|nr:Mediator of RNA polymerase II transcription subunit 12-like protein [Hypsibius exemplaris]
MASCPSSKRALRKGRLHADVYPQDVKQREDELSGITLKQGFTYNPVSQEHEHGSIKSANLSSVLVNKYFSELLAKKEELAVVPDLSKKRPLSVATSKDQFFPVIKPGNSKPAIESFFRELSISKPTPPAQVLPKRIPMWAKKEETFMALYENNVAYFKAAWYIKVVAAHAATQQDSKLKKRQVIDPSVEWAQLILKTLKDILQRQLEFYRIGTPEKSESLLTVTLAGSADRPDYDTLTKQWKYIYGLAHYMYEEGLLDRHEVCNWFVEIAEKLLRTSEKPADRGIFKLLVPNMLNFVQDIASSVILSRRLAAVCVKYLVGICQPNKAGAVASAKSPMQLIEEALECPHHRVPVLGFIGILQLIVIENPVACLWISLGEDRPASEKVTDGSPLDLLPMSPSQLPVSPTVATLYPDFKERIMASEEEIRRRSMLVDTKWQSPKTTSDTLDHVTMCLQALEALDRHAFHRQDPPDNSDKYDIEALYSNVFKSVPRDLSSETWRNDVEALIFFLCRWSTSTRRTGIHRGMLVACLLEKFQTELAKQLPPLDAATTSSHYIFQELLMKYLDEEGPKFEANGRAHDISVLESTVLLFSELISRGVFSHDAYVCALIATGLIPQTPVAQRQPLPPPYSFRPAESPRPSQHDGGGGGGGGYFMQPSPVGSSSGPGPGPVNNYEMMQAPPPVNYGVFAGASGEEYLRKNAVPQSPAYGGGGGGGGGFIDRKPNSMMSPYQGGGPPSYHSIPPFPRPPQPHTAGGMHHFYGGSPAAAAIPQMGGGGGGDFPMMDTYEKPASVSSVLSDGPVAPNMSPHYYYVLHFPVSHGRDASTSHELNQRAILMYGVGQAREQARLTTKQIIKDTEKLFSRKSCSDITDGRRPSRTAQYEPLKERFRQLPYFDRHVVSEAAVKVMIKRLNSLLSGAAPFLPVWENIQFVMELLESALNIRTLLNTVTQILSMLRPMADSAAFLSKPGSHLIQELVPTVMLIGVSMLRKYHCCLLLSADQTIQTFKTLRSCTLGILNPATCTSAARCVLAYIYDLYLSAGFLKAHFDEFERGRGSACEQIRNTIMAKLTAKSLQTQYRVCNPDFMQEYLAEPTMRPSADVIKLLTSNGPNELEYQRSFVVNAILRIYHEVDLDRVNDIAVLCAEMTASCNALTAEWIMSLQAVSKLGSYRASPRAPHHREQLGGLDIYDRNLHERLAIFCCVLVARHAVRLDMIVGHVCLVAMMASHHQEVTEEQLLAGRLATHIMVRLLQGPQEGSAAVFLKYPWDQSLVISTLRCQTVAPLLAILKALVILSSSRAISDEDRERSHSPQINTEYPPYGWNVDGLYDFARMALLDICEEEWPRDCVLRQLEILFSEDLLLDPSMKPRQSFELIQLLCQPRKLALSSRDDALDDHQLMLRVLRNLDQWNLRVGWVEVKLVMNSIMYNKFQQSYPNQLQITHGQTLAYQSIALDVFAKSVVEAFQKGKKGSRTQIELDTGDHTWYVAPLVSKLELSAQQKLLEYIVTQVMERTKNHEKKVEVIKSTILLGCPPFMAILTTCMNRPENKAEQKELLLKALFAQLNQFVQEDRQEDIRQRPAALGLRLSLAGSLIELIQKQPTVLYEWAVLLSQLMTSGCVDPVETQELFEMVYDFFVVLVQTALAVDQPVPGTDKLEDIRKCYLNLVKKIRKDCADKMIAGVEWVKMVLPLPKKTLDVMAVEPFGTVTDAKGNRTIPPVPFETADRKHSLQVQRKVSTDPWEVLEGFRNPSPLPWTFFNAIRVDRKLLTAEFISSQMAWHAHTPAKAAEYFLEAPPVPAEEELPARTPGGGDEPTNSETASVDTASPRSPRSRPSKSKKSTAGAGASKKRAASSRSPASVQQFLSSPAGQMGGGPYGDGSSGSGMMPQGWYGPPQPMQQPPRGYAFSGQQQQQSHPGPYPMPQHMDINRQRMPDQRQQARPQLQNMLQNRHAASQGTPHSLQQAANPNLAFILNTHPQGQPQQQRTNIQQLHLQSGGAPTGNPGGGVGGVSMMTPQGIMPTPHHPGGASYGAMRPPSIQTNPGMMSADAEFMKQQQMQRMRQQHLEMRNFQTQQQQQQQQQQGGVAYTGGGGGPQQGQMVQGDGSQAQPLYINDQQQPGGNVGMGGYLAEQQQHNQQQQAQFRQQQQQAGMPSAEYLHQQYQQQQQQRPRQ